jgi:cyclopropane fatty-acyl-phospholipid synthase-like methyltransferase
MLCITCNNGLNLIIKKEYTFFKCNNCKSIYKGFSFLSDYSTNSENYTKITDEEYFQSNVNSFSSNKIMNIIKNYSNQKSKILDIGCSNGSFLQALKENDINNVYGIDIQKETILFGQNKNLNCYHGFFPDEFPKELEKKYDIITSFENIYYMPNLLTFFEKVYNLLEKNGKLVLKFNQSSSSYYIKYPYHIRVGDFNTFINLDTISFLAKKYKFTIIDATPFANNYITDYLGYSSWKTKPTTKINFSLKIINKISKFIIPIKYADKIIIVLQKN